MNIYIRLFILLCIYMAAQPEAGAMLSTRLFDSSEIESSNYSSFCIDKDGDLWIGTQYGLLRFDGNNFDKYLHNENSETSLSDNRILNIFKDSSDRLWIGTGEGLNLYNSDTDDFSRVTLPNSQLLGYIPAIRELSDGNIVFIVSGWGLYIIDFSSGSPVAVKYMAQIENTLTVNTLCETKNGELIAGNHSGEIIRIFPNGQYKTYNVADSYIRILTHFTDDNIFISTSDKCWIWNPETDIFLPIDMPDGLNPSLQCAAVDESGNLLIGTFSHGLLSLEKNTLKLNRDTRLSNPVVDIERSRISTIYQEPSGDLWLGCPYQGIIMVPQREIPFSFINIARMAPGYYGGKTCVAISKNPDIIWTGLENGELISLDKKGNLLNIYRLSNGSISSLLSSSSGKIYAGVDNHGLYEIDPVSGAIRQIVNIEGTYMTPALTEDRDGNIYLGVHGHGVIKVDPRTGASVWLRDINKDAECKWISSLYCDTKNRLWIGMYGGLAVYDIGDNRYTSVGELYPEVIKGVHNSIRQDNKGRIWDATSIGLFIIDPEDHSCRRLTPNDGLSDIYVSTIVFDSEDNAWVGTHGGLNRISPDFSVIPFYGRNDMTNNDYFSSAITADGARLLFSGEKGITMLSPGQLKKPHENSVYVSGIFLNGKKVNLATLSSSGDKVLPDGKYDPERIRLSYRDNSLMIRLSTKDFRDADNLAFQWRIPGVIDDWTSTMPGSSVITLPHLRPGNYELEMRAVENGRYSHIKKIEISVSSPWYLSPVAKIIYFLFFCSVIVLVWKVMKHKRAERDNEERIKFFINISHEIRSPLTLILSPLEKILKKQHDPDTTKNLKAMHRNATRILSLINQLLDIRKIDKGKMEIRRSKTEFISFTSELVDMFRPQAEDKGQKLEFIVEDPGLESLNVWIDRYNFDKVLVNLISNAIKYTPSGGEISVAVGKGNNAAMGDYAEVKVSDTGIGIDENSLGHLFDRYFQGKFNRNDAPLGFGIGLDLCRMLVELHDGTITASNRTDRQGSCFTVRLPLKSVETLDYDTDSAEPERNIGPLITPMLNPDSKRNSRNQASKILIVDDDDEIRAFLRDTLSSFGRVTEATNGEEAMKSVLESMPDLIITDVVMPRMDGLTLLKTIKSNVDTNHIPVILLSSKNDVSARMAGWDKGADGYLGKPFIIEELQAMADNLIDNRLRLKGKLSGNQQQDEKIETPVLKGNDKILIDKIVSEIDKHLDNPSLNVEMLCQEVGLSRAHLNRKMKELFGLTPSDFIRNVRLRKACELLLQPDVDISQIAYSVGFSSQPHFSTAFKRFTGISPTEYRRTKSASPS